MSNPLRWDKRDILPLDSSPCRRESMATENRDSGNHPLVASDLANTSGSQVAKPVREPRRLQTCCDGPRPLSRGVGSAADASVVRKLILDRWDVGVDFRAGRRNCADAGSRPGVSTRAEVEWCTLRLVIVLK